MAYTVRKWAGAVLLHETTTISACVAENVRTGYVRELKAAGYDMDEGRAVEHGRVVHIYNGRQPWAGGLTAQVETFLSA